MRSMQQQLSQYNQKVLLQQQQHLLIRNVAIGLPRAIQIQHSPYNCKKHNGALPQSVEMHLFLPPHYEVLLDLRL